MGSQTITVSEASSGRLLAEIGGISLPAGIAMLTPRSGALVTGRVVEFYNQALDHYFATQDAAEIAELGAGVHPGWAPTGESFLAYRPLQSSGRAAPVCRFYGLPGAGLDSHFYSASAAECDAVAQRFAAAWQLESRDAFEALLPDPVTGACPSELQPVYRLWNNRADSDHRYTTQAAVRARMVGAGYVPEGYGPLGVAMCSLPGR